MKKIITQISYYIPVILLCFISFAEVKAQNRAYRFAVSGNIGLSNYDGDYGRNYFNFIKKGQMGLLGLHYYMSPRFNTALLSSIGDIRAFDQDDQEFDLSVKTLDLVFALKLMNVEKRFSPYFFAGAGYLYHEIGKTTDINHAVNFPMGGGLRYRVSPQFSFDLNLKQNFPLTELLDGSVSGDHYDDFVQYSFGLVFHFNRANDGDQDGVPDRYDNCPGTRQGLETDIWGCSMDDDKDGVLNEVDDCPNAPGSFRGCPDADGDGITDKEDKCPNEKGRATAQGCPDADADSITDKDDKCPDAPGEPSMKGCPDSDNDGIDDEDDRCPLSPGLPDNQGCPKRN